MAGLKMPTHATYSAAFLILTALTGGCVSDVRVELTAADSVEILVVDAVMK